MQPLGKPVVPDVYCRLSLAQRGERRVIGAGTPHHVHAAGQPRDGVRHRLVGSQERAVDDECAGLAVLDRVVQLVAGEARIHGDHHGGQAGEREPREGHLRHVGQHHRYVAPGADARGAQAMGETVHGGAQLAIRPPAAVGGEMQRDRLWRRVAGGVEQRADVARQGG